MEENRRLGAAVPRTERGVPATEKEVRGDTGREATASTLAAPLSTQERENTVTTLRGKTGEGDACSCTLREARGDTRQLRPMDRQGNEALAEGDTLLDVRAGRRSGGGSKDRW
ncbi:hypothetical protein ERJ75_000473100 [Trypanosoma vivax]|nr:hypothetical protein ERJ75_000473100 [Trypanosoma vivax]